MKSAMAIALAVSLFATSVPVNTQQSGPRLSNWARVRTIVPGTRISVGIAGPDEVQQYFVDATDEAITVLDLTNLDLPRAARRFVVRVAATQPAVLTATGWIEVTDGHVRVNQDGIFVRRRRVAALHEIVKTIDRGDVGEISRLRTTRQPPGSREIDAPPVPVLYGSSLLAGGLLAACGSPCGGRGGAALMLAALFAPAIAWTIIRNSRDRVTEVVYRAP